MKTLKLYENDAYLGRSEAEIIASECEHMSTENEEATYIVIFDRTNFFPEGGGQSSDTGTVKLEHAPEQEYLVTDVQEKDGLVYHTLVSKTPGPCLPPEPGMKVELTIDWDHRFDNMQRHLGEHILSGAFYRLFGAMNKGFHMGDSYMTVDYSFDGEPDTPVPMKSRAFGEGGASANKHFDRITWEMAKEAELEANRVIWSNAKVTRSFFDERKDAEKLPLRKHLAFDRDISIITVGDLDDPLDSVACCGTHPESTGAVGIIKVLKLEQNKGMTRVYLEAGERAYRLAASHYDILTGIAEKLSAGTEDAAQKFDALLEKNQKTKDELYHLRQSIIARSAEELAGLAAHNGLVHKELELGTADIIDITKKLKKGINEAGTGKLFSLVSLPDMTVILFSTDGNHKCGELVKENAPAYLGKGGGNNELARVRFEDPDGLNGFTDKIISLMGE